MKRDPKIQRVIKLNRETISNLSGTGSHSPTQRPNFTINPPDHLGGTRERQQGAVVNPVFLGCGGGGGGGGGDTGGPGTGTLVPGVCIDTVTTHNRGTVDGNCCTSPGNCATSPVLGCMTDDGGDGNDDGGGDDNDSIVNTCGECQSNLDDCGEPESYAVHNCEGWTKDCGDTYLCEPATKGAICAIGSLLFCHR